VTPPYEVIEHTHDVVGTGGAVLAILANGKVTEDGAEALASISLSTAATMSSTGGLAWSTSVRPVVLERTITKHDGDSYVPSRRNIWKGTARR
jgi:hypothetical protein